MESSTRTAIAVLIFCLMAGVATGAPKGPSGQLFGPTGIIGDATKDSIKVNGPQEGSPADGKLKKGDLITGIGATKFANVKRDMAAAIDVAETEAAAGKMTLMLKGDKTVEITLPVLGSYSKTAPYDCAKTDKIITMTAEAVLKNPRGLGSRLHPELLGLMATGEKKYIDEVAKSIQEADWAKPDQAKVDAVLAGEADAGHVTWGWGYHLITMCEYYLLTGDKSVLPGIETYAVVLAKGQDGGGLYGHRLVSPKRNGRLPGYGQMNQPSLTCFMGMLLAYKCGIKDPALDRAIPTTYRYVASHVGRGSFPYGVHGPKSGSFNNNGTSGSAALCMAFLNKAEGAKFFSRCAATSYDGLESGHASTFFNPIWTALGANLSGPEVTQQFLRKSLWYHNLRRGFDGNWSPDWKEGPHEGIALLVYSLPRKALFITGRKADESIWAKGQSATDVIMASKIDYKSKSDDELMILAMDHDLPQVRREASAAFGDRRDKLTPTWIKYLADGTDKQKKLAIEQYGWWHPIEVRLPRMDEIGAVLRDESAGFDVRVAAAGSLAQMKEPAQKYYMDIVKLLAMDKPSDPMGLADMGLGASLNTLCPDPFKSGLVTDKDTFYRAALRLVDHKRQHGRAAGLRMLAGMPLEDFHIVADKAIHVIEDKDPTYHSYHNPAHAVGAGVALLANLNIKEGIDYAQGIRWIPYGKGSFKLRAVMDCLAKFGSNARPVLDEMKADEKWQEISKNKKLARNWKNMVKAIEEDTGTRKLISLEDAIEAGKK